MPKITKISKEDLITYFYDGVKKYEHIIDINGQEEWTEYDKQGKKIHHKDSSGEEWAEYDKQGELIYSKHSNGCKWWYKEQKKIVAEKDVKPFEFKNKKL